MPAPHPAPPFTIDVRPLLTSGMVGTAPDGRWTMLIDNDQAEPEKTRAIYHETTHLLLLAVGQSDHDEARIEALATRLAEAGPELLALLGLDAPRPSTGPSMG